MMSPKQTKRLIKKRWRQLAKAEDAAVNEMKRPGGNQRAYTEFLTAYEAGAFGIKAVYTQSGAREFRLTENA